MRSKFNRAGMFVERIENLVGEGTPDVHGVIKSSERAYWMELKVATQPARESSKLLGQKGLRQEQKSWLARYTRQGGTALIVVKVIHRANRGREYSVFTATGSDAYAVNDWTMAEWRDRTLTNNMDQLITRLKEWW